MQMENCVTRSTGWVSVVLLAVLASGILGYQPFLRIALGAESQLLSLDARGDPLGEVLKKISNHTGYRITVDSEWTDLPVSGSFKNLPIDQGLRRILSKLNHSLIFNEADHRISIDIKSFHDGEGFQRGNLLRAADDYPPGGLQSSAVNLKDVINPGDIQVIPPAEPGGAGITLKEMQEIEAQRVKISTDDIEVIPPAEGGGKGVSLKESNAQQSLQKPTILKETELVPPDGFDRK